VVNLQYGTTPEHDKQILLHCAKIFAVQKAWHREKEALRNGFADSVDWFPVIVHSTRPMCHNNKHWWLPWTHVSPSCKKKASPSTKYFHQRLISVFNFDGWKRMYLFQPF